MEEQSPWTPLGGTLALLAQPAAWIAALVLLATHFSRNFAISMLISRVRQGHYAEMAMGQLIASIALFLVFAVVLFMLSRRLGGPQDSDGEPGYGPWIGLMFAYFIITYLSSTMAPVAVTLFGLGYASMPFVMGGVAFVVRVVFFPAIVFLVGQAHDSEAGTFTDAWSFLTTRGFGFLAGYVALCLSLAVLPAGLMIIMGPGGTMQTSTGMWIAAVVSAAGQLLTILFSIAAYRAVRANRKDNNPLVF